MLSVLGGHWRYAHMTALRCDPVNQLLLGMKEVVSENAVRRGLDKIEEGAGMAWLQEHLDYTTRLLLSEPWILDIDTTVKPLYGHQEGAVVSYNPHKPGRPSHSYHCYMMVNLRLVPAVEVAPGNQHTSKLSSPRLWEYLDGLAAELRPWLIRGDVGFGNELVMREAERRRQSYLFKLRLIKGVRRAIERAMGEQGWYLVRTIVTACPVARPPVRIRPTTSAHGGFYIQAFSRSRYSIPGRSVRSSTLTPALSIRMAVPMAA
jgi:hypothetical protein